MCEFELNAKEKKMFFLFFFTLVLYLTKVDDKLAGVSQSRSQIFLFYKSLKNYIFSVDMVKCDFGIGSLLISL